MGRDRFFCIWKGLSGWKMNILKYKHDTFKYFSTFINSKILLFHAFQVSYIRYFTTSVVFTSDMFIRLKAASGSFTSFRRRTWEVVVFISADDETSCIFSHGSNCFPTEISQQLSTRLPWNIVQICMIPRRWLPMTLVSPLLFSSATMRFIFVIFCEM